MYKIWRHGIGFHHERQSRPIIASRYDYKHSHRQTWHSHEQGQFVFAVRGVVRIVTPTSVWMLGPRRGLWIAPGVAHELHAIGEVSMRSVYFEPDVVPYEGLDCRVLTMSTLLEALVEAMIADKAHDPERRAPLIHPLLMKELRDAPVVTEGGLPLPVDRRLQEICEQLVLAPATSDSLGMWGDRVGASERTLARLFKEETGLTFGQWRQQLRIVEAISRLAQGMQVNRVAAELGYQNAGAFITMFRKITGETPSRYLSG